MQDTEDIADLNLSAELRETYEVLEVVGSGAMAVVVKARHRRLGRLVAIKFLTRTDEESRLRFEREARALAGLKHPRIVGCLDADTDGDNPYVVMELLDGATLHEAICGGPLEPHHALALVQQAAQGLAYLHANQVVHRDVKPANLLLAADGTVKVSDFGLARFSRTGFTITERGHAVGTPEYISPETITGQPATPASDVYALGVVLFELLTGLNPFRRPDLRAVLLAHVEVPAPDLGLYCPAASAELIALVARMLAKNPADRPADGTALLAELERAGAPASGRVAIPSRPTWAGGRLDDGPVTIAMPARPPVDAVVHAFSDAILAPLRRQRMHAAMAVILGFALTLDAGLYVANHRGALAGAASAVQTAAAGGALEALGGLAGLGGAAAAHVAQVTHESHARPLGAPIRISPPDMQRKGIVPLVRADSAPLSDLLMLRDLVDDLKRSYLSTSTGTWLPTNPLTIEVGLVEPPPGGATVDFELRAPAAGSLVVLISANGAAPVRMSPSNGRRRFTAHGVSAHRGLNLFTVTFVQTRTPVVEVLLDAVTVSLAAPGWAPPPADPMEPLLRPQDRAIARRMEAAMAAKTWSEAIGLAELLNARAPLYGPAWLARGVAIAEAGVRGTRADLEALDEAVRRMPSSEPAWSALARAYARHGWHEEARQALGYARTLKAPPAPPAPAP